MKNTGRGREFLWEFVAANLVSIKIPGHTTSHMIKFSVIQSLLQTTIDFLYFSMPTSKKNRNIVLFRQ